MSDLVLALDRELSYSTKGISLPIQDLTQSEFGSMLASILQKRNTPSAAVQKRVVPNTAGSAPLQMVHTLNSDTPEARSYDALVKAKIWTSKVATHLSDEYRHKLFKSLDRLHDIDEWEPGDAPMVDASFVTFLRTVLIVKHKKWPSLGLSHRGHLFGIWGNAHDRVTLEFLPDDQIKWVLTYKNHNGQTIRNAGGGPALSILSLLNPYDPEHWFHGRQQTAA